MSGRGLLLLMLGLGSFGAQAAPGYGWRGDGSSWLPDAASSGAWSRERATWTRPLSAKSHASPVVFGDLVCVLEEPHAIQCVEAGTGALAWRVEHSVAAALTGEARRAHEATVAEVSRLQASLAEAQRAHGVLLQRARRAPGDVAVMSELEAGSARLDELKGALDKLSGDLAEVVPEIGTAAATPVVVDDRIYTVFGNGVVAAHGRDGQVLWRRWVKPGRAKMRGYRVGHTASPRVVGQTLVVALGDLMGLDLDTGATKWEAGAYHDYGTPAVGVVGGVPLVVTPDGRVLRSSDGAVLTSQLGDQWYEGPHLHGDAVYFVGATGYGASDGPVAAQAWTLRAVDGGIEASLAWRTELPTQERIYATPVSDASRLYVVSASGTVVILDRETGQLERQVEAALPIPGKAYANPVLVGTALHVSFDHGVHVTLDTEAMTFGAPIVLSRGMATPWFGDGHAFIRTEVSLLRMDGP